MLNKDILISEGLLKILSLIQSVQQKAKFVPREHEIYHRITPYVDT